MKCFLFILANWINKLQEIVEGRAKTSASFKGVIAIKFYFYQILTKIPTKEERLNFRKVWKTRFRENFYFKGLLEP